MRALGGPNTSRCGSPTLSTFESSRDRWSQKSVWMRTRPHGARSVNPGPQPGSSLDDALDRPCEPSQHSPPSSCAISTPTDAHVRPIAEVEAGFGFGNARCRCPWSWRRRLHTTAALLLGELDDLARPDVERVRDQPQRLDGRAVLPPFDERDVCAVAATGEAELFLAYAPCLSEFADDCAERGLECCCCHGGRLTALQLLALQHMF